MKQVLITCDSCSRAVPSESIRNWWGLQKTDGDVPDMKFTPLRQDNLDQFKSHACSESCLVKMLMAFAESVDMKKVATAKTEAGRFMFPLMSYRSLFSDATDTNDSIGYYKKSEDEDDEEDSE